MSFVKKFNKQHPKFLQELLRVSPKITQREALLCMYLKLNYSNKEVSKLMNVSLSSVDSYRHRVRKKIKLHRSESIISFLNNI